MMDLERLPNRPRLLVSVRNRDEARSALAGGADIIDVKEPHRGSLGAADVPTIAEVVAAVKRRAPVTAAVGELADLWPENANRCLPPTLPADVALVKMGLAGCGSRLDWQQEWQCVIASLDTLARPVAVVYADWQWANAPEPDEILDAAVAAHSPAILVDTWRKSAGALFDHWSFAAVAEFVREVRERSMAVVLAGSLAGESLLAAVQADPDVIAVRGAACDTGREGTVSRRRVALLREILDQRPSPRASRLA